MTQNITKNVQSDRDRNAQHRAHDQLCATEAAVRFLTDYSRERPAVVAMWIFGVGFVLGWKLKPW